MNVSFAQSAAALNANANWQEAIADNIAASSIPGFKRQELSFGTFFGGMLPVTTQGSRPVMMPEATRSTNFSAGEQRHTGVKTDVALEGPGFIPVQLADGTTAYTRDGEMRINPTGRLVTKEGFEIMGRGGPIQLDLSRGSELSIAPDGQVSQNGEFVGNLQATEFNDPGLLTSTSRGFYLAIDPALDPQEAAAGTQFRQGYLEGANTSAADEMANLIAAMRIYEANHRAMETNNERMGKAISTLGLNT